MHRLCPELAGAGGAVPLPDDGAEVGVAHERLAQCIDAVVDVLDGQHAASLVLRVRLEAERVGVVRRVDVVVRGVVEEVDGAPDHVEAVEVMHDARRKVSAVCVVVVDRGVRT